MVQKGSGLQSSSTKSACLVGMGTPGVGHGMRGFGENKSVGGGRGLR